MISLPKLEGEDLERRCVDLCNLRVQDELKVVVELFESDLEYLRKQNDTATGENLTNQQGACQYIVAYLKRIDDARDHLGVVRG